jgi:putative hydrolase of the HAD superfamily
MIQAIIFDLGNTLMYFAGAWDRVLPQGAHALVEYLRAQGVHVPDEFGADFLETRKRGRMQSAQTDVEYTATLALRDTLAQQGITRLADDLFAFALQAFFAPEEREWVAYDDALPTLRELYTRGLRLGLLSNATDDAFVQRTVRRIGLDQYVDPILSSAALPWRKPDPRIFQHLLAYWQLPPEQVLMVGDWASTDILGAHRAGMRAILIQARWSEDALQIELPKHIEKPIVDQALLVPDAVVSALAEIPRQIEAFAAPRPLAARGRAPSRSQ